MLQDFQRASDHFRILCIKGLISFVDIEYKFDKK